MTTTEQAQIPSRPGRAWMSACAALCLAILAYGALGEREPANTLAYQLGYNLPIALFLAGALHLVFRKTETSSTSWLGFALVYAALVIGSIISNNRQKAELRQAATEIQQTISAVHAAASAGVPPTLPPPVAATGSSEAAKISVVMKTMVNRMVASRREYELELNAVGWERILDGQRLRADVTLAESRTMLQQAKDVVAKYKAKTPQLFTTIRADIETSDLSYSSKQSMLAGFDKSSAQGKAQALELWSIEEQVLGQFENVFNLLAAKRGAWQIQDGQVMFQRQADLDLFNTYVARVQSHVARQEQLQNAAIQKTQESLGQLAR